MSLSGRHELAALLLVVLAVGAAALAGAVIFDQAPATAGRLPLTQAYGVKIVWARIPAPTAGMRCYLLRKRVGKTPAVWLCG